MFVGVPAPPPGAVLRLPAGTTACFFLRESAIPIGLDGRKANRRLVDVSSLGAVDRFLHDQYVTFFVGVTNVGYCMVACEK